jgi:hypothetical protein
LREVRVRITSRRALVDNAPGNSRLVEGPAATLAAGSACWDGTTLQAGAAALPTFEHGDVPAPKSLFGSEVELSADALEHVIAARDSASPVLGGVDINPAQGSVCCTDGKILLSEPIPGNPDVPRTIMRYELARAIADFRKAGASNTVQLATEGSLQEVRMQGPEDERIILQARRIEGTYQPWRFAIKATPEHTVVLPKALLSDALKLQPYKRLTSNCLVISVTAGLVRIHSWLGAFPPWAIEYQMPGTDAHLPPVGLCVEYLRRVIDQSSDTVEITTQGPGRGLLIDRHRAGTRLIMPIIPKAGECTGPQAAYMPWTPPVPATGRKARKRKPSKADMLASLDAGRLDELRTMIRQL